MRAIADRAFKSGVTPLEVMLKDMRWFDAKADELLNEIMAGVDEGEAPPELLGKLAQLQSFREMVFKCAVEAAPYMHPRLAAIAAKQEQEPVIERIEVVFVDPKPPNVGNGFNNKNFEVPHHGTLGGGGGCFL